MRINENIICISSIDWDFVWQGHQEIMAAFAKNGNRVLFIENTGVRVPRFKDIQRLKKRFLNWFRSTNGFREVADNLYVYSPLIMPFPYSRFMRRINKHLLIKAIIRWMKAMKFHNPIIWTFLPTGTALDIIDNMDAKLVVYYCIADFYELADNPAKIKRTEDELIRKSDVIFAQGEALAKKCKQLNDNVYIFPFGVKVEVFENFRYISDKIPGDIKRIRKPIIGYIGGVHWHVDFELIRFIATSHPEWSIVLVGPEQISAAEINDLENVFLLGQKDFSLLPSYINEFDLGIVPYKINEYTATVFPTKLNEYHAMGKPVVSTDLPEVNKFNAENDNLVYVGKTYQEFVDYIASALNSVNKNLVTKRIISAKKNSWAVRIQEMSDILEDAIEKKESIPVEWRATFLKFYKTFRKKVVKWIALISAVFLLFFYTPLMWFIAEPLKIAQLPVKSDCIVVFAGGVGESGRAGQGYEERVQYAVELYKNGYAQHILFSSGYRYTFKEALIMKVLAVSLGIPENLIIIEDKAINTYENVKFTKEILDKNKWDSALFLSAPYHMKRVSLVSNKIAKDIKITYTPIPNSHFYSHSDKMIDGAKIIKQINFQQIRALLHEYLGIGYYWWKKWI